jgi:hypothetical protein
MHYTCSIEINKAHDENLYYNETMAVKQKRVLDEGASDVKEAAKKVFVCGFVKKMMFNFCES